MAQPFQLVDASAAFTPLPYGLLSAVQLVDDPDPHWQMGIEWTEDVCDVPFTVTGAPCGTPITAAPVASGIGSRAATPFAVMAWVPCAPIGQGQNLELIRERTERVLTNGESRAIEAAFWSGQVTGTGTANPGTGTVYPHLAANAEVFAEPQGAATVQLQTAATVVTSGTGVDIVEGVAGIEAALASCYGGEGVIHVPAGAVAHLAAWSQIERRGNQLRTRLGNIVAAYASGNRQGPTGANAPSGQGWIYGTGAMFGRRTPIRRAGQLPGEVIGRPENRTVYIVTRMYVLGFDCCHFAAQVSLGGIDSGGIGVAS